MAAATSDSSYDPAYAAIDTLFPGNQTSQGDLNMLLSRIHTLDNGNIRIIIPGGGANAGVASLGIASLQKDENELGVVAQQLGDVSAYVRDDFFVNASRVFALRGGDILMFSRDGDLDAGRGSKTAISSPAPRIIEVVNDDGSTSFVVEFPPTIAGSGIRNFAPAGTIPGDAFLFAPNGVINAGEAGIGTAGNFIGDATAITGDGGGIDAEGISIGIPTDSGGLSFTLSGTEVATGAQRSAGEQGRTLSNDEAEEENELALLVVEVLGFGEDDTQAASGSNDAVDNVESPVDNEEPVSQN